jgi:hypothetical protein
MGEAHREIIIDSVRRLVSQLGLARFQPNRL